MPPNLSQQRFQVEGLDCMDEANALRKTVGALKGVADLEFNLLQGAMVVTLDEQIVNLDQILGAIQNAGLTGFAQSRQATAPAQSALDDCSCCDHGQAAPEHRTWWQEHRQVVLCGVSGSLLLVGFVIHGIMAGDWLGAFADHSSAGSLPVPVIAIVVYLLATIAGGWEVFPRAWRALRTLRADMNLLMTIAVIGAIVIGQWLEAATVAFLFALSLLLESWSVGRARRAIGELLDLAPTTARVVDDGGGVPRETPAEQVLVGQRIAVRPGERFPLDGVVVSGFTSVNQAPITGESAPVDKAVGDEIFAGTINESGAIEVRVTQLSGNTTLARIGKLVEQAQSRKSRSEQWIDRFARWYTPAMIILAILVAVVPPLLLAAAWSAWFYEALVILVIACPCALVISTPVSIVSALASAARQGVLIKGGAYLEAVGRIDVLAIDKTGTLTLGRPVVKSLQAYSGHSDDEFLAIAAAIESHSEHPVGKAIVAKAHERQLTLPRADEFSALPGQGATASIDGERYWVGSLAYMRQRLGDRESKILDQAQQFADAGHTLVGIGTDVHVCGLISLADAVRDDAAQVVRDLHAVGVKSIVMLTGDNMRTAEAVGRELGIDLVRAELLPDQKLRFVTDALARGERIAMAGDGINDAPALAAATIGIAMGTGGTDAAIETADIALMTDDLGKLPWLIRHSRRTLRIIKQNITFALGLKVLFMVLAIMQMASLWMAITADMGASLLVTFNALRLLRK